VLARAVREDRIILSFDRDYGELIYHRRLPHLLRSSTCALPPTTPEEAADQVLVPVNIPGISLEGNLTTVERGQVRPRDLP
jgi:hypothetical protein